MWVVCAGPLEVGKDEWRWQLLSQGLLGKASVGAELRLLEALLLIHTNPSPIYIRTLQTLK